MRQPQLEFIDKMIRVVFAEGGLVGVLESVGEDGSLYIRQGRVPVWVPVHQIRYVTLLEPEGPPEEEEVEDDH